MRRDRLRQKKKNSFTKLQQKKNNKENFLLTLARLYVKKKCLYNNLVSIEFFNERIFREKILI